MVAEDKTKLDVKPVQPSKAVLFERLGKKLSAAQIEKDNSMLLS